MYLIKIPYRSLVVLIKSGSSIDSFYGDGAFDTNDLFSLIHQVGAIPVIKIRKNASPNRVRGPKNRRRAIREYQEKGYRTWSEDNEYSMRWPGTEGIFSAVKRKFGENCTSQSVRGLEAEGYQRLWVYDHINQGAMMKVKSMS